MRRGQQRDIARIRGEADSLYGATISLRTVSVGNMSVGNMSVGNMSVGNMSAYESAPGSIEPGALSIRYIAGTAQSWRLQTLANQKRGAPACHRGAPALREC